MQTTSPSHPLEGEKTAIFKDLIYYNIMGDKLLHIIAATFQRLGFYM